MSTDIRLFPNPGGEVLHLQRAELSALLRVELVDLNGRVLAKGVEEFSLSVDHLSAGLYFCRQRKDFVRIACRQPSLSSCPSAGGDTKKQKSRL